MSKLISISLAVASIFVAAGCANNPNTATRTDPMISSERGVAYGTIRRIEQIEPERSGAGAGAIIGGVVGGVLGNQVGHGDGKAAATVIGAVGGAVAGNEIEKSRRSSNPVYQYSVQLDRGDYKTFTFANDQGYATGQRVVLVDGVMQQRY